MYKIQTLNKIAACGLERLPREAYETASELGHPDGILVRSQDMHSFELPETLLAIARAGAGTNNIPIPAATEKGIVVFNTPGANANAVKELVIAAMLLSSRRIVQGLNWSQSLKGKGDEVPELVEKGKAQFVGPEIAGKTLGVIGLGAIGVMIANAAAALGVKVIGFDPYISVEAARKMNTAVQKATNLDALVAESDFITIHVPLTPETKSLFSKERLARTKKGARIINLSRSGLVDNTALKAELASGRLGGYVTDFPEDDLLGIDNILAIPHLGASTPEAEDNCAIMAADQLREYLERGNIRNSVNFPAAEMAPTGKTRITIANKNVPNMIGQVTTILAKHKLNIDDMLNKNRGEVAYSIIDVGGEVQATLKDELSAIKGVLLVRVIDNCN